MPWTDAEALIQRIKKKLDATHPTKFMTMTADLREGDFTLIGQLVQTYCFADLNARRLINSIRGITGRKQNGGKLNDKDVLIHLRKCAEELPDLNTKNGLLSAAKTVEMHRELRHLFAHWAVRRIKGEEAFVAFTKNAREGSRRDGEELNEDEFKYGLVPLVPLRAEMGKLVAHAKYIAESAVFVEENLEALKKQITETADARRPGGQTPPGETSSESQN